LFDLFAEKHGCRLAKHRLIVGNMAIILAPEECHRACDISPRYYRRDCQRMSINALNRLKFS
jgi:hypothetical protein